MNLVPWANPSGRMSVSKSLDSLGVFGNVDDHGHPQQNTLGAAALLSGRLPRQRGTHRLSRRRFRIHYWLHRSSPQKSISGATSSTPYSQPSGR